MGLRVEAPIQLGRGLNDRLHHMQRHRKTKQEQDAVAWILHGKDKPAIPCTVLITRIAPSSGLDDDNLAGACKGARDAFAKWIRVDDKHRDQVRYEYAHERGPWGLRIEVLA